VKVSIGEPIGRDQLDPLARDSKAMMALLRKSTYGLACESMINPLALGYEFEDRRRG
jgi:hypothetical protein